MSSQVMAALVGAGVGGIVALFGSIAQVFMQGWISDRGKITCNVAAWTLRFAYDVYALNRSDPKDEHLYNAAYDVPLEVARTYKAVPGSADSLELAKGKYASRYDPKYFDGSYSFRAHLNEGT